MSEDLPAADEPDRAEPESPEKGYPVAPPIPRSVDPEPIYSTTPEDEAGAEPEKDPTRYQFSLQELLLLMVGVSLLMSLLGVIPSGYTSANFAGLAGWGALLGLVVLEPIFEEDLQPDQTKRCRVPEEKFDFLGYTFGRYYSPRTGRAYLGARPSAKAIRKLCESITEQTSRRYLLLDPETLVGRLNRQLRGWATYFCHGASQAVSLVDRHVTRRLRRWLCRKHKVPSGGYTRFSYDYLTHDLGLIRLPVLRRNLPCTKA